MGGKVGGLSHKCYCETAGIKVSNGQTVKSGAVLTREGDKWKPGLNVIGSMKLTAGVSGTIYFTRKRNKSGKVITLVNVKPTDAPVKKA
jgi:ribosomal protein L27